MTGRCHQTAGRFGSLFVVDRCLNPSKVKGEAAPWAPPASPLSGSCQIRVLCAWDLSDPSNAEPCQSSLFPSLPNFYLHCLSSAVMQVTPRCDNPHHHEPILLRFASFHLFINYGRIAG